jgi:serine/threonine-protein kinase mTOR
VSVKYPQGVVFQLMLAAQSKTDRRRRSATKLIQTLKQHHAKFVEQADTISKELHKVAILQEEEW